MGDGHRDHGPATTKSPQCEQDSDPRNDGQAGACSSKEQGSVGGLRKRLRRTFGRPGALATSLVIGAHRGAQACRRNPLHVP